MSGYKYAVCLEQKAMEEKSNEITAIPELLDKIQIKGQIVTIDAMDTHKEFSKKIRSKRADYVLALKRNQENLYEDVSFFFDEEKKNLRNMENYKKKPIAKLKFENTIRPIRLNG